MTANTIAPADLDILRAIAAGDRVHHMRRRRLTNMGLVTSAGDLTKLGAEAIAPEQAPAKKVAPTNACGCGCGELCKGLWRPGHDARWAGETGRTITAQAPITADDDYIRREATRAAEQVGASEALTAKVVRVALTARAKKAKRKAA